MNNNMRNKGRSAIYMMAGAYLFYSAYQVFKNRADSAGTEYVLVLIGAVAFLIIGMGLIGFGCYNIYAIMKEERNALEEQLAQEESLQEQLLQEESLEEQASQEE